MLCVYIYLMCVSHDVCVCIRDSCISVHVRMHTFIYVLCMPVYEYEQGTK